MGLVAFTLVACAKPVDPRSLTQATVPLYHPAKTNVADAPTIKSIFTPSTGFLGSPATVTFLVAIDGQYFDGGRRSDPHPVPAGPHVISIGYATRGRSSQVAVLVDFKPGASYVIRQDNSGLTLNSINNAGPDDILWVEDEKTGLAITPKQSTTIYDNPDRYVPPSDATSTISGSRGGQFLDHFVSFIQMVDGKIVNGDGAASILEGEHGRPDYAVPVAAGRHAMAIRIDYNLTYGVFPLYFDVKPSTSYVVKFEGPLSKIIGNRQTYVISFWIEEMGSGALALPKVDMPISYGRKYKPEELGTETPPAAPTQP